MDHLEAMRLPPSESLRLAATAKTSGSATAEVLAMSESDSFGKVRDAIDGMVRELKQQQRLDVKKKDWCKQELVPEESESCAREESNLHDAKLRQVLAVPVSLRCRSSLRTRRLPMLQQIIRPP